MRVVRLISNPEYCPPGRCLHLPGFISWPLLGLKPSPGSPHVPREGSISHRRLSTSLNPNQFTGFHFLLRNDPGFATRPRGKSGGMRCETPSFSQHPGLPWPAPLFNPSLQPGYKRSSPPLPAPGASPLTETNVYNWVGTVKSSPARIPEILGGVCPSKLPRRAASLSPTLTNCPSITARRCHNRVALHPRMSPSPVGQPEIGKFIRTKSLDPPDSPAFPQGWAIP